MTKKITKVIAALGVVAGLGVAALPLSSYADSTDVEVQVLIGETVVIDEPDCTSPSSVAAGVVADSECEIDISSNTGVTISIKDKDATLVLTGYSDGFEGTNPLAPAASIPAINSQLANGSFNFAGIGSINGGSGGWGYMFETGSTVGLTVNTANVGGTTTASLWNAITATDKVVASSNVATTTNGAKFSFRAVTPTTQASGYYSDVVVITAAVNP